MTNPTGDSDGPDSTHGHAGHGSGPTVGPLAVEAGLLLDAIAERLASMRESVAAGSASDATSGITLVNGRCPECGSIPGASCAACPLCRLLALIRGERPEATAKLVDGALLIVRTLRSMLPEPSERPTPPEKAEPDTDSGAAPTAPRAGARRPTGLEHIEIR